MEHLVIPVYAPVSQFKRIAVLPYTDELSQYIHDLQLKAKYATPLDGPTILRLVPENILMYTHPKLYKLMYEDAQDAAICRLYKGNPLQNVKMPTKPNVAEIVFDLSGKWHLMLTQRNSGVFFSPKATRIVNGELGYEIE